MALAIVLILLVVGSVLFHFLSPWWFTPIASNWTTIDSTIDLTFWVTGAVFIAVNLFMAYAIVKFRNREGIKADYEPENAKLEGWLTIITAVGVAALLAPGLVVWAQFVNVPDEAKEVEAVGQQWHWSFRYPGADGEFGKIETKHITLNNPFGLNPEDPAGQDDILIASPELHIPLNEPIKILLRSKDVLHDFAVAQFRVKMDLVPGLVTYVWLTPTRTGKFEILCEELCGVAHHAMRGNVVVDERADYEVWLSKQPTFAETQAVPAGNAQAGAGLYAVCASCHGANGEGNPALHAPKLAGQDDWYMKRQIKYFQTGVRGSHEKDIYGKQMAPMAAMLADDATLNNVMAYIGTLPDSKPAATISGDVNRGKKHYTTCAYCHGPKGEGRWMMNAPRLAGIGDAALKTQLKNYQDGVRGMHPEDLYGNQMVAMAKVLLDDKAVDDVIAYINTL